tara:strand:- start:78 stop:311 length:234 start_codon:yes stop_codon:yes gene_type:complete
METITAVKVTKATGVSGILINVLGKTVFRVYDDTHNFVDYDLHHSDLQVTIQDDDACFYVDQDRAILDHSPETLGKA